MERVVEVMVSIVQTMYMCEQPRVIEEYSVLTISTTRNRIPRNHTHFNVVCANGHSAILDGAFRPRGANIYELRR